VSVARGVAVVVVVVVVVVFDFLSAFAVALTGRTATDSGATCGVGDRSATESSRLVDESSVRCSRTSTHIAAVGRLDEATVGRLCQKNHAIMHLFE
jgi:hypothetical protein